MISRFPRFLALGILGVGGMILAIFLSASSKPPVEESTEPILEPTRASTFEQMLQNGEDAIYVEDQHSGQASVQVGFLTLSSPGYIVVFDDHDGVPGSIIGTSPLLQVGEEHLTVSLDQSLEEQQVYYAILYHDNGDGVFDAQEDPQVLDAARSVVLMTFLATAESQPESGPVLP